MSNRVIGGVNLSGYKLSKKTADAVKAMEEAESRLLKFKRENAEYAESSVRQLTYGGATTKIRKPRALVLAEAELNKRDEEAVAAGEPLPDRGEALARVNAKIEEYKRTVKALTRTVESAREAAGAAVLEELPALASQALKKSAKAKAEYEAAYEAMEAAKGSLETSVNGFISVVSKGAMSRAWIRGMNRDGDQYAGCLEFTDEGKLTYESAWNLHLVGAHSLQVDMIELGDLVDGEAPEEQTTPFHANHVSLGGAAYSANLGRFV